jgi:transposase
MQITTIGIDLAKNVFRVHGVDRAGKAALRKKVTRRQLLPLLADLGPSLVGMEACSGAHYWAREIEKLGHQVRLINPRFVTPYVKTNKERRQRCRSDLRGRQPSRDAVRSDQEPSAAGRAVGAPSPRSPDAPAQLADQSNARPPG